jgi:flagellar biosynthetic protein FliR
VLDVIRSAVEAMATGFLVRVPLFVLAVLVLVLALIAIRFVMGLAARVAPAIQIFFILQPLNLLLGTALIAATLGTMLTFFAHAMGVICIVLKV